MSAANVRTPMQFCQFCPHAVHGQQKCEKCRCKGKARWWQKALDRVGDAIGEAKFGGQ